LSYFLNRRFFLKSSLSISIFTGIGVLAPILWAKSKASSLTLLDTNSEDKALWQVFKAGFKDPKDFEKFVIAAKKELPELLSVKKNIHQAVQDDYTNGRTLQIDGWVLSSTEVQSLVCLFDSAEK
jgi:hypothetical protein